MKTRIQSKKASLPQDWHPADIKAALEKAGWSLRRLSAHHGYEASMCIKALRRPYPNAERLIAEAIGVPPEAIWPSRYDDRRPLRGVGGAPTHKAGARTPNKGTTPAKACNGNQGEAA
jgi:Ner family transcriptional regulator